jgi:hypothetical protein
LDKILHGVAIHVEVAGVVEHCVVCECVGSAVADVYAVFVRFCNVVSYDVVVRVVNIYADVLAVAHIVRSNNVAAAIAVELDAESVVKSIVCNVVAVGRFQVNRSGITDNVASYSVTVRIIQIDRVTFHVADSILRNRVVAGVIQVNRIAALKVTDVIVDDSVAV